MQNYNTLANMLDELEVESEVVLLTFMCTGGQMQIQGRRKKEKRDYVGLPWHVICKLCGCVSKVRA